MRKCQKVHTHRAPHSERQWSAVCRKREGRKGLVASRELTLATDDGIAHGQNFIKTPSFTKRPCIVCVGTPNVGPNVWVSFSTTLELSKL